VGGGGGAPGEIKTLVNYKLKWVAGVWPTIKRSKPT